MEVLISTFVVGIYVMLSLILYNLYLIRKKNGKR